MARRFTLAAVALVVLAWLGLRVRETHYLNQAGALPGNNIGRLIAELRTPSGLAKRRDALRKAGLLNPDTRPDQLLAQILQLRAGPGDTTMALRIAESVVQDEPQNIAAWSTLLDVQLKRQDYAGELAAYAHVRELDPLDAKS